VGHGSFTDEFSSQVGDGALYVGSIGSWAVDIASGGEAGGLNITLTDNINGNTTQTHGLEVLYSSGAYGLDGNYNFGASDSGGNSLTAQVTGYYGNTLYEGTGSKGTSLEPSSFVSPTDPAGPWTLQKTFAQSYQNIDIPISGIDYITEEMVFGGGTGRIPPQRVSMNAVASFTPYTAPSAVPDGAVTFTLTGATLLGMIGLRSKFGAHRS